MHTDVPPIHVDFDATFLSVLVTQAERRVGGISSFSATPTAVVDRSGKRTSDLRDRGDGERNETLEHARPITYIKRCRPT